MAKVVVAGGIPKSWPMILNIAVTKAAIKATCESSRTACNEIPSMSRLVRLEETSARYMSTVLTRRNEFIPFRRLLRYSSSIDPTMEPMFCSLSLLRAQQSTLMTAFQARLFNSPLICRFNFTISSESAVAGALLRNAGGT
jgi:hypothetical protein